MPWEHMGGTYLSTTESEQDIGVKVSSSLCSSAAKQLTEPTTSSSRPSIIGTATHTCRMFLGRQEPTSLRQRQNDQNTQKCGQKHHFHATILARRRQKGPRRRQTLKSFQLISLMRWNLSTLSPLAHSVDIRQISTRGIYNFLALPDILLR